MDGITDHDPVMVQEKPGPAGQIPPLRYYRFIGPGFVKAAGERLVAGRDMTWTDVHEKRNVAMMSENLAREYFSSPAEAIGKHVRETDVGVWHEVIGVIGDMHDDGADQPAPKIIYYPLINVNFWGRPIDAQRSVAFVVRSDRAGSAALLGEARRALWSVDPRLPVAEARTLGEIYNHSMERTSFALVMLGISAGMALVLGVLGIYGVISYTVAQKGREIGIRIALGAPHGAVQRLFVRQAMLLAGSGALLGVAMALALTRLMKALLYGVSPIDPLTYGAVCAVLLGAALLAAYVPARRATLSVDPVDALRSQ
jgi:hypothetical protein